MRLPYFLATITTEDKANLVPCPVRIMAWIAFLLVVGLAIVAVAVLHQQIDLAELMRALGWFVTAVALAIYVNSKSSD